MTTTAEKRRVVLLDTDDRAGLVASIANTCSDRGVSLEITTGPGHVIVSFASEDAKLDGLIDSLRAIDGVSNVYPYEVATA